MPSWPSFNQAILMGRVVKVTRIQWEDGATSALINLATQKRIADRVTGSWRKGMDFHQVEVSPGEPVFKVAWPGTIIQVRGELDQFTWKPEGARVAVNRHVLIARGFQVVQDSPEPYETPKTVLRKYRIAGAENRASEGHTDFEKGDS